MELIKTFPGVSPELAARRAARWAYDNAIVKYRAGSRPEPRGPGSAIERWWAECHAHPHVAAMKSALDAARNA